MNKLTLNADDLQVLSFATGEVPREEGMVCGHAHTHGLTCARPCVPTLNVLPTSPCVCIQ